MSDTILFKHVNEEGEVYEISQTWEDAQNILKKFPNDSIIVHFEGTQPAIPSSRRWSTDDERYALRTVLEQANSTPGTDLPSALWGASVTIRELRDVMSSG